MLKDIPFNAALNRLARLIKTEAAGVVGQGVILNPKTLEPLVIELKQKRYFTSVHLHGSFKYDTTSIGRSEFEGPAVNAAIKNLSKLASDVTGYPRVHVDEVLEVGKGYGTALYAATAYVAKLTTEPNVYNGGKPGVCSGPPRATLANSWWRKATSKGFAKQQKIVITEEQKGIYFGSGGVGTEYVVNVLTEESVLRHGLILMDSNGNPINSNIELWLSIKMNMSIAQNLLEAFKQLNPSAEQLQQFEAKINSTDKAESSGYDGSKFFPTLTDL